MRGARARCVIAVDVGGTTIKAALCDRDHEVLHRAGRPTPRADAAAVVDAIVSVVGALAGEARRRLGPEAVAGAGLAVPGLVDEARGVALRAANLPWRDLPLAEIVSERTALQVALCHDVRAAAAAEAALGSGRDGADFLFVAVGTGVGGALVIAGVPYLGAHGRAGELGHTVVEPAGPRCACGARGCVEAIASAVAIERAYAETGGADGTSAGEVVALARAGDPVAREVWARAVAALATGLADAVALLDPARIVVGGGLAATGADLLDPLAAELGARLTVGPPPPVVAGELGPEAGCRGAGLIAWRAAGPGAARPGTAPGMMRGG